MALDSRAHERFMYTILPGVALFAALVILASAGMGAMPTGLGVFLSFGGALAIGLGILLARSVVSDVLSLRDLRARFVERVDSLRERTRVAVQGRIRCTDPDRTLVSPFGGHRCASYTYRVTRRQHVRGSSDSGSQDQTVTIAQGVHVSPARLFDDSGDVGLLSLPVAAIELRDHPKPAECKSRVVELFETLKSAGWATRDEREGRLYSHRDLLDGPVAEDYGRYDEIPRHLDDLTLEEEWVPVDEPVCLIGVYDPTRIGLAAGERPFGRPLLAYPGTRSEVLERLAGEARGFGIAALALLIVGVVLSAIPFVAGSA